ncbi:hypothetical protein AD006_28655 (plasmid) [Pseudonocardia sp. EC080610-09]|nr:hypothetical protein AD006_28655 [Pseudonocardia sp. EC080610-09]ALL85261.1 hypothetical protein AD017_29045 [Pseudonocardia sp. EC080619-01]
MSRGQSQSTGMPTDLGHEQTRHSHGSGGEMVLLIVGTEFGQPVVDIGGGFVELVCGVAVLPHAAAVERFVGLGRCDRLEEAGGLCDQRCQNRADVVVVAVDPELLGVSCASGPARVAGELFVGPVVGEQGVETIQPVAESLAGTDAQGGTEFGGGQAELLALAQEPAFASTFLPPAPGAEQDRVLVVGCGDGGGYACSSAVEDPADHIAGVSSQL